MLGRHTRAALQFSGGKDSLALLHLARPHLDKVTVFFGDTGSVYPHVFDFVTKTCRDMGADLVTVRPYMPVLDYHEEKGLPVDVLPIDASPELGQYMPHYEGPRLQSWLSCCSEMLWLPMEQAIRERGFTLVLRGSKACDPHVGAPDGTVHEGVEYRSPLWTWSDDDVMAYLDGKEMPAQYPEIRDSMDCWCCTALLSGKYATAKLEYARTHYPELWPIMRARLQAMQRAVAQHTAIVNGVIEQVTHG